MEKFIKDICEDICINVPKISYDTSRFPTETMLAAYDSDEDTIYLRKDVKNKLDLYFSIAHELRHKWQLKEDEEFYFGNYKSVQELGVEYYNKQIAELDANAFATAMIWDYFGAKPTFKGLSEEIIYLIYALSEQI